jgi:hypothetical protein
VDGKRHLPVLRAERSTGAEGPEGDGEVKRPPWQWVGFGAVAIFVAWLPLSAIAGALAARLAAASDVEGHHLGRTGAVIIALYALAIAVGSFGGGFVVGRWGGEGVGRREAGLAGLMAAVVAIGGAWVASGISAGTLLVAVVAASSAAAGGGRGLVARTRAR